MSLLLKIRGSLLTHVLRAPSLLHDVSDRSYQLCPEERQFAPAALYLPRDLDRVTSVMEDTSIELEMKRITGGEHLHAATVAHELGDVDLSDGFVFKGGWKDRLLENPSPHTPLRYIDHGTLAGTFYGARYFAHWMADDLTLALAAETTGHAFVPTRKAYGHEDEYLQIFQVHTNKLGRARFRKLTLIRDHGQNSYKKQRYEEMRRRLLTKVGPVASGRKIFLHRGGSGVSRLLRNESEIEELLVQYGFTVVDPAKLGSLEIVRQCAGAGIVLGVEGSQLAHALYTIAGDGVLCALQPPYRFNNFFKDHADCIGFRYAFLTGLATEGGFQVPLDDIRELLDRLLSADPRTGDR